MKKLLMCAAALAVLGATAPAQARDGGVKVGTLSCHQAGGWGMIVGSTRRVQCAFDNGYRVEHYAGSITRIGMDVGYQRSGTLVWSVIAPHVDMSRGALAGHYGGITAGASVGVGLGANALVGGLDRSFALQPVSVEGTTGLHAAAGVGGMTLWASRRG
ncbi:MAG TPA: DUF992 domain-containing protein [Caulobacteraceae bacterium]|jgi:di/tricarboxylate transporter|nr:DUF992 domain-containing protein [Caulobacteraceae bacterium]